MTRVEVEKSAIERALREQSNISKAARSLHVARRTLQSRMRDYSIPPGKAGRPRELISYGGEIKSATGILVVILGAFGIGYLISLRKTTVAGLEKSSDLRGLDAII